MKLISKFIALALMTGTLFTTEPVSTIATAKENQVVITTIVDNYVLDPALKMRWGLAVSVVSPTAAVLFDTGPDGDALIRHHAEYLDRYAVHSASGRCFSQTSHAAYSG